MARLTQRQRVLNHIIKNGSIDRRTSVNDLGIYELAARISELEHEGHRFTKESNAAKTADGYTTHYTTYRL